MAFWKGDGAWVLDGALETVRWAWMVGMGVSAAFVYRAWNLRFWRNVKDTGVVVGYSAESHGACYMVISESGLLATVWCGKSFSAAMLAS